MSENRPPDDNHGDRPAAQRSQSMPDLNTTEEAQFNLPDFIVDELFLPDDYSLWGLESAPVSEAGSVEPTYSTGLRTPTTHYLDFTTEHANHPVNDDAIDTIPSQIPGIGNPLSSEPQSIQHQHISQAGGTSSRDSGVNVAPSPQFNVPTVTAQSRERRRQQNRAAQQAYRDRKDAHIRSLETQLRDLQARYTALVDAVRSLGADIQRLVTLHVPDFEDGVVWLRGGDLDD